MHRRLRAALLAAAGLLCARAAAAGSPAPLVDLRYEVDPSLPGCPGLAEFRALVAAQLGYDPFRGDAELGVVVRAWQGENGIEGRLDWGTDAENSVGERRFTSPGQTCREVIPAMGFALVVKIQMLAHEAPHEAPPNPADAHPTVAADPAKVPLPTWSLSGGLGASVARGLAEERLGLGRLFVAARRASLSLELGGEASLSASTRFDRSGFRHDFWLGSAAACWQPSGLVACALGKAGVLRVQGQDVDNPASPHGFVAQTGARVGWALLLGDHLGVLARVEALYLISPWTVQLNHVAAWTVPRISASAGIDIFVHGK